MTWAAWVSKKYIKEYYSMLAPTWYNADNLAANGINAVKLKADLALLARGVIPDVEPPEPPPLPTPPEPGPAPGSEVLVYVTVPETTAGLPAGRYGLVKLP